MSVHKTLGIDVPEYVADEMYLICIFVFTFKPPPPGHLPNAAQMAAMQGANVVMTQRKGNFFMGGSNGGYTIW